MERNGRSFLTDCLLKMVVADPEKRISAIELLKEVEAYENGFDRKEEIKE